MTINITLSEANQKIANWGEFCQELGLDYWCCNEGFGNSYITLTEEQAKKFGLLTSDDQ